MEMPVFSASVAVMSINCRVRWSVASRGVESNIFNFKKGKMQWDLLLLLRVGCLSYLRCSAATSRVPSATKFLDVANVGRREVCDYRKDVCSHHTRLPE